MLKLRGIVWGMVVGVALGGMVKLAVGQDEGPRGQPGSKAVPALPGPLAQPSAPDFTVTVDFPGGTVGQYVQLLKQASGRNAVNVVMSRAATEVQIGTISMREVSLYTALSAVQTAAGRDSIWHVTPLTALKGSVAEAYALEYASAQNSRTMSSSGDSGIKVFSIRNLIDPMPGDPPGVRLTKTPEVVLTAVRAALDLTGDRGGEAAEMKFHEDSGLLIIHGNNEQVGSVSQTLSEMETDVRKRRDAARSNMAPGVDIVELQTQVKKLEVMMGQRQRDLERMQAAAERAKTLLTAGQMSQGDYAEVAGKLDEARSQVELGAIDLERAKAAYEEATKGPGAGREARKDELQARYDALGEMVGRTQALMSQAKDMDQTASVRKQVDDLQAQRNQVAVELGTLRRLEDIESQKVKKDAAAPAGKSVVVYDLPPMDAKAREQLISAIKGLETVINNSERLKVQSVQDSKLVIEADGGMHEVVRGMLKEVSGARGQPDNADGGKKPRGTK